MLRGSSDCSLQTSMTSIENAGDHPGIAATLIDQSCLTSSANFWNVCYPENRSQIVNVSATGTVVTSTSSPVSVDASGGARLSACDVVQAMRGDAECGSESATANALGHARRQDRDGVPRQRHCAHLYRHGRHPVQPLCHHLCVHHR